MRIKVIKNGHPLSLADRNIIRSAFRQRVLSIEAYYKKKLPDFEKLEGNTLWIGCTKEGCYTYSEYMNID